ncbi:TP53-binding protein 1 isoform X2 [Synchiropus splendidus]|uniref:TP53-binding protein 1 isoform X2 n=1 Tax=Synchiropus splendidus TaxID=270530 RepID=UPI00237DD839|nr:TP53-binding protein 1 isoform X2 [Synchiropus splendidus]
MEPSGSELDSSLPQPENPCLIVEDSQPDSVALEDDPETSYRALLARRLSSLQPSSRSPVLELIASPPNTCSQTDSQSDSNSHQDYQATSDSCSAFHEESQVLSICPAPPNKRCSSDTDMESGADSTTNCQSEEGNSQFGLLALSQSQDLCGEAENCHDVSQPTDLNPSKLETNKSGTSESQDHKALRSEVSSSSSSEHHSQSGRQLSVQVLLHSESHQNSGELDQQDCDIQSSQQDMFDAEKTGAAVDSTVSEPEQQGLPTSTPAQTLHLLHLSGHETLVQESLSQSSIDCIAPTPDNFSHTPLIVPSSPTELENKLCADEPMDTSLPLEGREAEKEAEPMDTDPASKPQPSASTPLSQNCPGFMLERTLSLPSQPEFSHDVFAASQSPQQSDKKSPSLPLESQSQQLESAATFALPLQLSAQLESSCPAARHSEEALEDSQATQIEEMDEPVGVNTSDSVLSHHDHKSNGMSSDLQAGIAAETPAAADAPISSTNVKDNGSVAVVSCSQSKRNSVDLTVDMCIQETPSSQASQSMIAQTTETDVAEERVEVDEKTANSDSQLKRCDTVCSSQNDKEEEKEEEVMEEEVDERAVEGEGVALVLSQSQVLSPEPMEEQSMDQENAVLKEVESAAQPSKSNDLSVTEVLNGLETKMKDPEPEGLKDKSLSDSSGEISFHFTLPKEGESMGPAVAATPPLISQMKRSHRHSTPIETASFSEKSDVVEDVSVDVAMAAGDMGRGESGGDAAGEGKLSLRMKLVTPVEEGSSDNFSLQKPSLSEDASVAKVTTDIKAVSSPSVFTRVRQVHRQQETRDDSPAAGDVQPFRGELFASPQRLSQSSSLGCNSLPNSQQEPPENVKDSTVPNEPSEEVTSELSRADGPHKAAAQQSADNTATSTPSNNKNHHRSISQQTSLDAVGPRSPGNKDADTPSFRRTAGPAHRRHVRTIQEVRTTITRIITDVYYEDGKEVDRKVTEESEEPVVDCQVLDSDISPCRTGSSSVTSGDLADISSLSSKASSLQHSSGGTSSTTGPPRPDFIIPGVRGTKSSRRGGGQKHRGLVTQDKGFSTLGSPTDFVSPTAGGRARRGRPPSCSPSSRGRAGSLQQLGPHGPPLSSSEDEPYTRLQSPHHPVSPTVSDLLRSSPDQARSCSNSLVGLRVVAKWSSNGYFYSGRIIKDAGEGRFRLRFDDGYECEVPGKDVLLCDPIPLETEVTALLEDEYFSVGVVKGYRTEGQDLFYSVEKDGQKQWYNRTSVILSLEQGNRLREQHSLGPYEPSTPLAKASDISLDNLVEGKRRRRVGTGGLNATSHSTLGSPRTPGTSFKRKAVSSDDERTPVKRGRRLPAAKAAPRVGVCNTSGSGTDLPGQSGDLAETHGPLPENTSLFMGFAFMLTASSESDRLTNRLSSDDDEDYVQTGPFNKKYTESQLQAGGGFILPDFNEEQCKAAYQSLLIADQHCRTRKYLLCLASGVPCVSHIWVRDCCRDNKLLNYRNYLLPAGIGPDNTPVEWHPRSFPFKSLKFLLVFEKPEELLAQLATMGGASSTRHFQPDKDGTDVPAAGKFDVVLMDQSCPPSLQENVTSQKIPLVSAEWLIQSLITGERQEFNSKPQYHHNYSSTTTSSSSSS